MEKKILIISRHIEKNDPLEALLLSTDFKIDLINQDHGNDPTQLSGKTDADLVVFDISVSVSDDMQFNSAIAEHCQSHNIPLLALLEKPLSSMDSLINSPALVFDYLTKPFDYAILLQRVRILTRLKGRRNHLKGAHREIKETKNSIMPDYIASMAHDLRNQLHGILSFSNFGIKKIDEKTATDEKLRHYYTGVKESGTRLLNLLNNIIFLAKLECGKLPFKMEERNLTTVVNGIMAELFPRLSQEGLSIHLTGTDKDALADLDAKLLGQAIKNLFLHEWQLHRLMT